MSKRKEDNEFIVESGLMTHQEASSYLRVNTDTLRNWINQKQLVYYRLGRRRMYMKSDLDAYIESNRIDYVK